MPVQLIRPTCLVFSNLNFFARVFLAFWFMIHVVLSFNPFQILWISKTSPQELLCRAFSLNPWKSLLQSLPSSILQSLPTVFSVVFFSFQQLSSFAWFKTVESQKCCFWSGLGPYLSSRRRLQACSGFPIVTIIPRETSPLIGIGFRCWSTRCCQEWWGGASAAGCCQEEQDIRVFWRKKTF